MNIKEIFNWIKEKIEGNRIERLTEGKNEIVPEKKSTFKDKIKYDTKTKKVDIEKDYEKLLEEYNKKFEELEKLTAEIVLDANDVKFNENENCRKDYHWLHLRILLLNPLWCLGMYC